MMAGLKDQVAASSNDGGRLPVTLLSGFLGSGKTTLLRRILTNKEGLKVAVIVNDMAELNIDAATVAHSKLIQREEKLVTMQNGCICCTLREDLVEEVGKLALSHAFDYLVIESTGISEPMQVAETFTFDLPAQLQEQLKLLPSLTPAPGSDALGNGGAEEGQAAAKRRPASREGHGGGHAEHADGGGGGSSSGGGAAEAAAAVPAAAAAASSSCGLDGCTLDHSQRPACLSAVARLDTCVTVVDAATFWDNLSSIEELKDRFGDQVESGDERHISGLLLEQVEFANVIILNKCDLVTEAQRAAVRAALVRLNPAATVYDTVRANVDLRSIMGTRSFELEAAAKAPGWLQAMKQGDQPKPESEEYGITSFVYRARAPFHPGRLYHAFMEKYFMSKVIDVQDGPEEGGGDDNGEGECKDDNGSDGGDSDPTGNESASTGGDDNESQADASVEQEERTEQDNGDSTGSEGGDAPAAKDDLGAYEAARREVAGNMKRDLGFVIRSKGFVWLATLPHTMVAWGHAGLVLQMTKEGPWFCTIPRDEWPCEAEAVRQIEADMDSSQPDIGDRRQELVFIGQGLNVSAIKASLDACLATPEELAELPMMEDPLFGADSSSSSSEDDDGSKDSSAG